MTATRVKVVSASAAGGGTGSETNPYTLAEMFALINGAPAGVWANSVFLFENGVYPYATDGNLSNGGSRYGDLTFKARNPRQAILRAAVGPASTLIQTFKLTTASNASYITWDGLFFDGNFAAGGTGNLGIQTSIGANLHHHTVRNCRFNGLQGNGAEFASCDYLTFVGNVGWVGGLRQPGSPLPNSTSSALTINAKSSPFVFDAYTGFHNIVAYNAFAGWYGRDTDGNGLIIDNGGTSTGGNDGKGTLTIGNTLVIRNLVYGCGGRGIHNLRCASAQGHFFVHNLCFKNCLDKTMSFNTSGFGSEMDVHLGGPTTLINNITVPWTGSANYGTTAYRDNDGTTSSVYHLFGNKEVSGGRHSSHMVGGAGAIDVITDPGFIAALTYNPDTTLPSQVPDPATIGNAFQLLGTSVLKDAGVDPTITGGMTANQIADALPYLTRDFRGWIAPF